jgi:AcrR family transcriptional regulator
MMTWALTDIDLDPAERADVTTAATYYYFDGMDQILEALFPRQSHQNQQQRRHHNDAARAQGPPLLDPAAGRA